MKCKIDHAYLAWDFGLRPCCSITLNVDVPGSSRGADRDDCLFASGSNREMRFCSDTRLNCLLFSTI